jgi:methyl-accepting chemotaxis protein
MPAFISNLSVAKRLGLGFALVLALSLISTIAGISRLASVAQATRYMVEDPIRTERLISDWYRNIHTGVRRTSAIAKSSDASLATYFAEDTVASTKNSSELQKAIEGLMTNERDKALFAEIGEQRKAYLVTRDAIVALKKEGKFDEANQLLDQKFTPGSKIYISKIEALMNAQRSDIDKLA